MGFNGIGKAIQRIRGKGQQRHQDRINRDDLRPKSRPKDRQRAKAELKQ